MYMSKIDAQQQEQEVVVAWMLDVDEPERWNERMKNLCAKWRRNGLHLPPTKTLRTGNT